MAKVPLQHLDLLGVSIEINDLVVYNYWNSQLTVGRVVKFTPKKIRVSKLGSTTSSRSIYPADSVKITDEAAITMYVLKNGK